MNLYVDIGNSRIKWAQANSELIHSYDAYFYNKDNIIDRVESTWKILPRPDQVFISNVAGEVVANIISSYIENSWSISATFLSVSKEAVGVINGYNEINQLGIDRWLAIIAGWNLYQKAVCVVDCGTALTVDVITATGQHKGGYIVPGSRLMAEVLNGQTHLINSEANPKTSRHPGTITSECIANGALGATAALIESVFEHLKREYGKDSQCVITGGGADEIRELLSFDANYEPHLVLIGIATLIDNSS